MYKIAYKYRYLGLLLAISLIVHHYIFTSTGELSAGDWVYIHKDYLASLLSLRSWVAHSNLGFPVPVPNNLPFYWLAAVLRILFGFDWNTSTKVIFLLPITIFPPLFSFLLFEKIFRNERMAFFASCLYTYNTLFLKFQLDFITFAVVWAIFPGMVLSLVSFLEKPTKKHWVLSLVYVALAIVYEARLSLVALAFITFYTLVWVFMDSRQLVEKVKRLFSYFLSIFFGLTMHLFWILPYFLSTDLRSSISGNIHTEMFLSFHNIIDAFTLHSYQWYKGLVMYPFTVQPIEPQMFLVPILALLGFYIGRGIRKNNTQYIVFGISLIISLFFTKQSNAPFKNVYGFLFQYLPLFVIFRESSKFFHILALSMAFFFALGIEKVFQIFKKKSHRLAFITIGLLLLFTTFYNSRNFITQTVGGMTKEVLVPTETQKLNKFLISNRGVYRVAPFTYDRFIYQSDFHPGLINIFTIYSTYFPKNGNPYDYDNLAKAIRSERFRLLLGKLNVKYIILPLEEKYVRVFSINNSDMSSNYEDLYPGKKMDEFENLFSQVGYLKKVAQFGKLTVYENLFFIPKITVEHRLDHVLSKPELTFNQKTHSEYEVSLYTQSNDLTLEFAESYHSGWKIVGCNSKPFWYKIIHNQNCVLNDTFHHTSDYMMNEFKFDLKSLCKLEDVCTNSNPKNANFRIIFYPDYYMNIGIVISIAIIIAIILFLLRFKFAPQKG